MGLPAAVAVGPCDRRRRAIGCGVPLPLPGDGSGGSPVTGSVLAPRACRTSANTVLFGNAWSIVSSEGQALAAACGAAAAAAAPAAALASSASASAAMRSFMAAREKREEGGSNTRELREREAACERGDCRRAGLVPQCSGRRPGRQ